MKKRTWLMFTPVTSHAVLCEMVPEIVLPLSGLLKATVGAANALAEYIPANAAETARVQLAIR